MHSVLNPDPRNRVEATTGIYNSHSKKGAPLKADEDPELGGMEIPRPISVKQATTYKSNLHVDHTTGRVHTVG